jgi:hypothetical protein
MATEPINRDFEQSKYMLQHGRHCIEYIRQSLMCSPDLSLEPVNGTSGNPKDWGVETTCVDFGEVEKWAVEELFNDEEGIV